MPPLVATATVSCCSVLLATLGGVSERTFAESRGHTSPRRVLWGRELVELGVAGCVRVRRRQEPMDVLLCKKVRPK